MQLSIDLIEYLVKSPEQFPIDLNDAWQWLEFKSKRAAKDLLLDAFIEDLDFLRDVPKATGGRPSEVFLLSVDCFKSMGMMANTQKGREIRRYFLECEQRLKEQLRSQPTQPQTPPPEKPKSLPPAKGWTQEAWDELPLQDQQYFSENEYQEAERVYRERKDIEQYLNRSLRL